MVRSSLQSIRDTDAVVFPRSNPLQEAIELRRLRQPDYRALELEMQNQRLQDYQENLQRQLGQKEQGKYLAAMKQLDAVSKTNPGGYYSKFITSKIKDLSDQMTNDYLTKGFIDPSVYQPEFNKVANDEAVGKQVVDAAKKYATSMKGYVTDPNAYTDWVMQHMVFDGEDKNGNPILRDPSKIDVQNDLNKLSNNPDQLKFLNQSKILSDFFRTLGKDTESHTVGSADPYGSYLHSLTSVIYPMMRPTTVQTETPMGLMTNTEAGLPVDNSGKVNIPDTPETRKLMANEVNVPGGKELIANNLLYERAMGDPALSKVMDFAFRQYNAKQPSEKQVLDNTPEADVIKRRWLLQALSPSMSTKITEKKISRETQLGQMRSEAKAGNITASNFFPTLINAAEKGDNATLSKFGLQFKPAEMGDLAKTTMDIAGIHPPEVVDLSGWLSAYKGVEVPPSKPGEAPKYAPVENAYIVKGSPNIMYKDAQGNFHAMQPEQQNYVKLALTKAVFGTKAADELARETVGTSQPKPSRLKRVVERVRSAVTPKSKEKKIKVPGF